ncbi:thiamine pyrophosphate-binding protein [Thioalkalivibrio sp. HK1]|uniref:thiamine pyrophosphate-binding protein n=1 Tax=Thioalkalivibrio sp. HK1 TaxID=1469245 RepID=UPI0004700792|nr:thiamine pyrophosphate-binding protein [Thioalkalivibrio sp. HK1]
MTHPLPRTGARILVDALAIHGVDTVFCVPGESYLAVLDALHESHRSIRTITCRHEAGAANMAEAFGKSTGRPGVAMVTRGPGACHASIGLHTAAQDSTPMILFIGQVALGASEREAFQEIDYRKFLAPICKWTGQIDDPARIPELLSRAFHQSVSGRPGPVAIALPEDMLRKEATVHDTKAYRPISPGVASDDLHPLRSLLAEAQRPMAIVGGGGWNAKASEDLAQFAEGNRIPVAASFRCQDRLDNRHPCYVGDLGTAADPDLARRVREADLLLVIGARLGEITTCGYELVSVPEPRQRLIHIHPDPEELGRVYRPTYAICAASDRFLSAAAEMPPVDFSAWDDHTASARAAYLASLESTPDLPGALQMGEVMAYLRNRLPPEAILTTDAGNFSGWMQRHYLYRAWPSQIGPTSGAMGYGIPAAISARLVFPDRPVVGFCGDGGALMSGQEIATAIHHGIDPVILVVDNGMYGTIRLHQERDYPGRTIATSLSNPDFTAWARSFGAFAERVERSEDFPAAFERALGAGRIAVLELPIDPELITTRASLSQLRGTGSPH